MKTKMHPSAECLQKYRYFTLIELLVNMSQYNCNCA